jgi:hypothetical protein
MSLIVSLLFIGHNLVAQEAKPFGIKSGYIEYSLTGNTVGTKKVWWDNYGQYKRTEIKAKSTSKVFGMTSQEEINTVEIINKEDVYVWDYTKQSGTQTKITGYQSSLFTDEEAEVIADELIAQLGGERLGTEKVLGKTCEIISLVGTKVWIYKGIALKSEAKVLMLTNFEMAKVFEENKSVTASLFKPSADMSFRNISQEMESLFGSLDMDDDDDEEDIVPLNYPYSSFQKVVSAYNIPGYSKPIIGNYDGQYIARYVKTLSQSIVVTLTSKENVELSDDEEYETFNHNGKTCYYYTSIEDGESSAVLMVDYPKHNMSLIIVEMPAISKQSTINHSNNIQF